MLPKAKVYRFRPRTLACPFAGPGPNGCTRLFADRSGLTRHINASHRRPPVALGPPSDASRARTPSIPVDGVEDEHDEHVEDGSAEALDPLDPGSPQQPGFRPGGGPTRSSTDSGDQHTAQARVEYHPLLNGRICDQDGNFLPEGTLPSPLPEKCPADYSPFNSRTDFEIADFLYRRAEMSGGKIDELLELWACTLPEGQDPPFANHRHLYNTIDASSQGDAAWQNFSVMYAGAIPQGPMPSWMVREYDIWFRDPRQVLRDQMGNPDFAGSYDYAPKRVFLANGKRQYKDFMSGDWAWTTADTIAQDPKMHGATLSAPILGSDKTTVSVATGQNEYYPLYITNGGVTNTVRRAHRNAITLLGFLAIPKTERQYQDDPTFRTFRRELFHTSLRFILQPLREVMTNYEVLRCADGHFRRVVYSLGPYIADYPEQVLLSCIVQGWCARCTAPATDLDTGQAPRRSQEHTEALREALHPRQAWDDYGVIPDLVPFTADFPRADIHELLSPDLLHQVIKGSFKDHLVTWVEEYLIRVHGKAGAAVIMSDIDRRIAAVPSFPGLRRFPEGRGFKQWTGDDSKALMKVYLPAISGHVPAQMIRALSAFLEFCYLVRRDAIDEDTLLAIDDALEHFHRERVIFETTGVRPNGISLPRQHALKHYRRLIQLFGSPNGVCSSMMEAKHIIAVKKPYRRSSRHQALGQIIKVNQRLDKLAAMRTDFTARGMLDGPCPRLPRFMSSASEDRDAIIEHYEDDEQGSGDNLEEEVTDAPQPSVASESRDPQARASADPAVDNVDDADLDIEAVTPGTDDILMAEVVLSARPVTGYPKRAVDLGRVIGITTLVDKIRFFLYDQLSPNSDISGAEAGIQHCPIYDGNISVYPSAVATFYAPSDPSGTRGMHRERIRSTASWRGGAARRDCVFVAHSDAPGFRGLLVARIHLFFAFTFQAVRYPCALVSWFSTVGDEPNLDTGMWVVEKDYGDDGELLMDVIHIDSIMRGAHLIGVAGDEHLPLGIGPEHSLDVFRTFYVNKYADHHAHEVAF
ncbi:hypothetical protein C8Q79DRAFT_1054442 [Trametes meyenii]|nr:hypothetical protein C8Q79DRAFT_1054442 [Trametes meyenii]